MRPGARLLTAGGLVTLSLGAVLWGQEPPLGQDRVVPVYEEPRHRQVFQSGTTRVLELLVRPGDTSLFHSHTDPVLYVNFSTGALRTQELGKDWSSPPQGRGGARGAAAGQPGAPPAGPAAPRPAVRASSTTSYAEQPLTHRITNTGTTIVHALVVVNQTGGDDATTVQAAGFDGMPEVNNRWYRAYRFTLNPGQAVSHRHAAPAVLAQTTDGTATARGTLLWALNAPSHWAFFDAGDAHEVRNTGSTAVEFIEVEVRQPAR